VDATECRRLLLPSLLLLLLLLLSWLLLLPPAAPDASTPRVRRLVRIVNDADTAASTSACGAAARSPTAAAPAVSGRGCRTRAGAPAASACMAATMRACLSASPSWPNDAFAHAAGVTDPSELCVLKLTPLLLLLLLVAFAGPPAPDKSCDACSCCAICCHEAGWRRTLLPAVSSSVSAPVGCGHECAAAALMCMPRCCCFTCCWLSVACAEAFAQVPPLTPLALALMLPSWWAACFSDSVDANSNDI
jgi:hypothetical protein